MFESLKKNENILFTAPFFDNTIVFLNLCNLFKNCININGCQVLFAIAFYLFQDYHNVVL